MEGETALFTAETARSLLIMATGAFAVPLVSRPLRLPAAVGEILFGMLVGPHLLGWVVLTDFARLIGLLGFFLLMLMAGMELDFSLVEKVGRRKLGRMGLKVLAVFAFSFILAGLLGMPWFVGMILSAISIGLPLMLLQETRHSRTLFGQQVLLVGSLGEFLCIVLATGVAAWCRAGGLNLLFLDKIGKLLLVFALAWALLFVLRIAVWWKAEAFSRMTETHDPSEIGVRAGLALMFVLVAVTARFGIDPILGAFMAGALFSFVFRAKGPLELKFLSLGNGFFVPFFFITVGLDFHLELALQSDLVAFLELLVALLAVRFLALYLFRGPGSSPREALAGSLLLSAPLTLLVVLGDMGLRLGLIDKVFNTTVILLAVVASIVYPFLFKMLARGIPVPHTEERAGGRLASRFLQ